MGRPITQQAQITARHITRSPDGTHTLLGQALVADADGLGGRQGWQGATYDDRLGDTGDFTLRLPNTAGRDGRLHRDRFALVAGAPYHPGDEWIELWREGDSDPLTVATLVDSELTASALTLTGRDARGGEVLGKQRETAAGFLLGAPHDVIADLCQAWTVPIHHAPAEALSYTPAGTIRTGYAQTVWRAEATFRRASTSTAVTLAVGSGATACWVTAGATTAQVASDGDSTTRSDVQAGTEVHLALEGRGRYVFAYLGGALLAVLGVAHRDETQTVQATGTGTVSGLLVRQRAPLLHPAILDRRTPGSPPATGLQGAYFDEADIPHPGRRLAPTAKAYAKRVDPTVAFAAGNPPTWQPAGQGGAMLSARWTGSIYLDLATSDIRLRTVTTGRVRVHVGDTHPGAELIDDWPAASSTESTITAPWLRQLLGSRSGWYPIVIAWTGDTGPGGVTLQAQAGPTGPWTTPGTDGPALSPYGIYEHYARHDSHTSQITDIQTQTGLQTRLQPRSLESGEFPGRLEIAIRVGGDTDYVLRTEDATDLSRQSTSGDVASSLICEAQLPVVVTNPSDPNATVNEQAYLEVLSHDEIDRHLLLHQDVESLADISDRVLLAQRAQSIAALRTSANEQINARPAGFRELAVTVAGIDAVLQVPDGQTVPDTFVLEGELAELRWRAGDGIRRQAEHLGISDPLPTPIVSVGWTAVPDGLGAPTVSFRSRPRGLITRLRDLSRRVSLVARDHSTP